MSKMYLLMSKGKGQQILIVYILFQLFFLLLCINMSSRRHRKGHIGAIIFH